MKLFSFLASAMGDGENPSAMRLIMVFGVTLILAVWAVVCVHTSAVTEIPQSIIEVLGLLIGGKVIQSHIESNPPPAA